MAGMMDSLYDRLEGYEEIPKCYGSLEDALMEEKLRGDRLEKELDTLRDVGIKLRRYPKKRFDRLFSAFQHARQRGDYCGVVLGKQDDRLVRIHDLEKEIERLRTALSEAISADLEMNRRDTVTARASVESEYQQEITSLRQKLKYRIAQLESIRALRYAGATKYQDASASDQQKQRVTNLEE